jgi:hypothetical protein
VFGTHGRGIEAAAVIGHLDRHGLLRCCDADGGAGCPSVLDHVGQGFLAEAVQLRFDLGPQRQARVGPVDLERAHLALTDVTGARILLREARFFLEQRPHLGILPTQADQLQPNSTRSAKPPQTARG